jgi:putative FmdB family regulatory protein
MPTYDFHCPECGLDFEVQRPFSRATEPAKCPTDGSEAERVFTMPMTFVPGSAQEQATTMPDFSDHGHDHGHSHGPGGHTH